MNPNPSSGSGRLDVAFVGGGLASGLAAYRLAQRRPDLAIAVFEAADMVGGNHTWSFHENDLTPAEHAWVRPFVAHAWSSYEVRFPDRRKSLATGYRSVTSEAFRAVIEPVLGDRIATGTGASAVSATTIEFVDGRLVTAGCVIDGRGHAPSPHLRLGYQKFLGREFELEMPHGVFEPIIMDATVTQADGYRFVYVLPLTATRLLVEDTYYADGPALEEERLRASIDAYLAAHGWTARRILREEHGVLPIAIDGDISAFWAEKNGVPAIGLASGLFHPTTGYSLPDAVRTADLIAHLPDLSAPSVYAALHDHSVATWKARGFFRMLNRLLFFAGASSKRYKILQHFYRLPDPLVARFYGAKLSRSDKLRILTGKPPVPFANAIKVLARHRLTGDLA